MDRDTLVHVRSEVSKILHVVLTGSPNPLLWVWSLLTVVVNFLLALLTLDLVFRGPLLHPADELRFSRVGFVDSRSAKVLFREPDVDMMPIYVHYRQESSDQWNAADMIYHLDGDTDFTYPITFSSLLPKTSYTYALSNNLTGNFTTAPAAGTPAANSLTFLTSSCIKANFPYRIFNHALDIPGFEHLSKALTSLPSPALFMLFLGDFIYVDVPLRLSSTAAHYRAEYRRVYASRSWSLPLVSSLPWLHTIDDHEIANDWSSGNSTPPYPAARDPFLHYHVSVNPPIAPRSPHPTGNFTYSQFTTGPASFFLLDTRAYRTPSIPFERANSSPTILGPVQLHSLLAFLRSPEPSYVHWKIVASSVPFTKNWRFGTADTWGGYLNERAEVLEAMHFAEHRLGVRVVILSGDRHEFGAIRFPDPQKKLQSLKYQSGPHEFSVGPLSMFYLPFRTFRQVDEEDVTIKYIPDGNSKLGIVHLEGVEGDRVKSLMRYSLWVDGRVAWEYVLTSPAEEFLDRGGVGGGLGAWTSSIWS